MEEDEINEHKFLTIEDVKLSGHKHFSPHHSKFVLGLKKSDILSSHLVQNPDDFYKWIRNPEVLDLAMCMLKSDNANTISGESLRYVLLGITYNKQGGENERNVPFTMSLRVYKGKASGASLLQATTCIDQFELHSSDKENRNVIRVGIEEVEKVWVVSVYFALRTIATIWENCNLFKTILCNRRIVGNALELYALVSSEEGENEEAKLETRTAVAEAVDSMHDSNEEFTVHRKELLCIGVVPSSVKILQAHFDSKSDIHIDPEHIIVETSTRNKIMIYRNGGSNVYLEDQSPDTGADEFISVETTLEIDDFVGWFTNSRGELVEGVKQDDTTARIGWNGIEYCVIWDGETFLKWDNNKTAFFKKEPPTVTFNDVGQKQIKFETETWTSNPGLEANYWRKPWTPSIDTLNKLMRKPWLSKAIVENIFSGSDVDEDEDLTEDNKKTMMDIKTAFQTQCKINEIFGKDTIVPFPLDWQLDLAHVVSIDNIVKIVKNCFDKPLKLETFVNFLTHEDEEAVIWKSTKDGVMHLKNTQMTDHIKHIEFLKNSGDNQISLHSYNIQLKNTMLEMIDWMYRQEPRSTLIETHVGKNDRKNRSFYNLIFLLNSVPANLRYGNRMTNKQIHEYLDPMGNEKKKLTSKEKCVNAMWKWSLAPEDVLSDYRSFFDECRKGGIEIVPVQCDKYPNNNRVKSSSQFCDENRFCIENQ